MPLYLLAAASGHQLLIGQLGHGRHGRPQVSAGRRQDVADGDAASLVPAHGGGVGLQVVQQGRRDHLQQLPSPHRTVLLAAPPPGAGATP